MTAIKGFGTGDHGLFPLHGDGAGRADRHTQAASVTAFFINGCCDGFIHDLLSLQMGRGSIFNDGVLDLD